jgi:hypothetical protein
MGFLQWHRFPGTLFLAVQSRAFIFHNVRHIAEHVPRNIDGVHAKLAWVLFEEGGFEKRQILLDLLAIAVLLFIGKPFEWGVNLSLPLSD